MANLGRIKPGDSPEEVRRAQAFSNIQMERIEGIFDAEYVTMSLSDNLANERKLTAGSALELTDGGAGGNATLGVATDGINDTHIDFGTGANQVSAVDVPIADAGSHYIGTEIETALQELGGVREFFNGTFDEAFDALITSDGSTVTLNIEKSGGGDLIMNFSDGKTVFDTTPAATIVLTAGTDTNPQTNFVYILQSTKALTVSTSDWPVAEHIKVSTIVSQSASATQSLGILRNQNWNDPKQSTVAQGHMSHFGERLRQEAAKWESGLEATLTIVGAPTPDDVFIATTAGVVYQMHKQTFPATDMATGGDVHIVNHSTTPFVISANLSDQVLDSTGATLANKSFSFVIWGVMNKTGEESHIMVNLPSGTYKNSKPQEAVDDSEHSSVYTISKQFQGVGFLIARLTFQLSSSGLVWTLYDNEDLRGFIPNISAGSGAGGTGVVTFLGLSDTPNAYVGPGLQLLQVNENATPNALEFTTQPTIPDFTLANHTHAASGATGGVVDHVNLSNIGTNTHAQIDTHIAASTIHFTEAAITHDNIIAGTIASHDTTATGTELDTLTGGTTNADLLHQHSELVASDGSPDPALQVNAAGNVFVGTDSSDALLGVGSGSQINEFEVGRWAHLSGNENNGRSVVGSNLYAKNAQTFAYALTHGAIGAVGINFHYPDYGGMAFLNSGVSQSSTKDANFTPNYLLNIRSNGNVEFYGDIVPIGGTQTIDGNLSIAGDLTITEAKNIILGTTTGTQIGTDPAQKLGFFGSTAVVQQNTLHGANYPGIPYTPSYNATYEPTGRTEIQTDIETLFQSIDTIMDALDALGLAVITV